MNAVEIELAVGEIGGNRISYGPGLPNLTEVTTIDLLAGDMHEDVLEICEGVIGTAHELGFYSIAFGWGQCPQDSSRRTLTPIVAVAQNCCN